MPDKNLIYVYIAIPVVFTLLCVLGIYKIARKIKQHRRIKQIKSAPEQQLVRSSVEFSGAIRAIDADNGITTKDMSKISNVESITCQDELGQQLTFSRCKGKLDKQLYREVTYSASDSVSHAIQLAIPAAQQVYTAIALSRMAPYGLFTATVNPVELSHFASDGTFTTIVRGSKNIVNHAGFQKIPGFGGFNPVAIAAIAFQAMAIVSGNYYLHQINQKLDAIKSSIQDIMRYHTSQDIGTLNYSHNRLLDITDHTENTDDDMEDIRVIKRDIGKLYNQYLVMYKQQKQELVDYRFAQVDVDQRMGRFSEEVQKFCVTAKICAASYQIYLQAALTEICVSMKSSIQKVKLDNMIKDANSICNNSFEDPSADFDWVQSYAKGILESMTWKEKLFGIGTEKRQNLLAPYETWTSDLHECVLMSKTDAPEKALSELQENKRILLMPGESNSSPRIFVPA